MRFRDQVVSGDSETQSNCLRVAEKLNKRARIITGMRESWQHVEVKVQVWPAGLIGITR